MRTKYTFQGRYAGRYFWTAPFAPGYEEVVSCDVDWFWGKR